MGIIKSRPKFELYVPDPIFIGEPFKLRVDVVAKEQTPVDFIELGVRGVQGWRVSAGKSGITRQAEVPNLVARLMESGTLMTNTPRGFQAEFTLPRGAAPTHALRPAWSHVEVWIHASIPWWPDAKETYHVVARLPPPAEVVRTPAIGKSRVSAFDDARLEISLASTHLVAGEVLVGSCAAFHMDDRKAREVEIEIVPQLTMHGPGRPRVRRAHGFVATVTLPPGSAGTGVPFQIALPETMTPSFQAATHELDWFLVASTGSLFSGKTQASLPLAIVDRSAAATTPKLVAPPVLGDERVAAVFDRFAASQHWRRLPADETGEIVVAFEHGKSELQLAYSYRKQAGAYLVGRVKYPSLGLDLTVVPSSTLRHLFFEDIEVDIAAWDRGHLASARSAVQTKPFLKALVPALVAVDVFGLSRLDDDEIALDRAVAGVEDNELVTAAATLRRLSKAIEKARPEIQPPPGLGVDLAAWRALAEKLEGELSLGDLSIDGGQIQRVPVELGLAFAEGDPLEFRISAGSFDAASGALRELEWKVARPADEIILASVSPEIIERVSRWPQHVVDLQVKGGVARATVQLGGPRHPDLLGDLAKDLVMILKSLDVGVGPYR